MPSHPKKRSPKSPESQPIAPQAPVIPSAAASAAAAAEHFTRGVLTRGEAAPAGEPLPLAATHEIIEAQPGQLPTIRRKRFRLF